MSTTLAEILPPLPTAQKLRERQRMPLPDSPIVMVVQEADPLDWGTIGLQTFDDWCLRVDYDESQKHPGDATYAFKPDTTDSHLGNYWSEMCSQNQCCVSSYALPLDQAVAFNPADRPRWMVRYLLGLAKTTQGKETGGAQFFNTWCSYALQARRGAIRQMWDTIVISNNLLRSQQLQHQLNSIWASRYLALQTNIRATMTLKDQGCMLPGCIDTFADGDDGFYAKHFLQPFVGCNISVQSLPNEQP